MKSDEDQHPMKKSPSIQGESSSRPNPFFDENKANKSSFLYPHNEPNNSSSSQIKNINTPFSTFSRSEMNVSTPMSTRNHDEDQHSYFESTTPSLLSRSLFIEQEQLQPVQSSTMRIRHTVDIDDPEDNKTDKSEENENDELLSLEKKYSIATTPRRTNTEKNSEVLIKKIVDVNDEEYPIGSRVLVNTDHHIFNKLGFVRYVGKTYFKEGTWYGIELEEAVGKYNYFSFPLSLSLFIRLINKVVNQICYQFESINTTRFYQLSRTCNDDVVLFLGKNNGSFGGHMYFQCPDKHGVFVRRDKIRRFTTK